MVAERVQERVWRAQPRQRDFLKRREDEVLYGGAAGGGKSDALLIFSVMRRTKHPGSKGLFLRRSYAELSKSGSAIARSMELLTGLARWDGQEHKWRFPNGSVLEFGYLEAEQDKYRYQSAQYDDVVFDELTQVQEHQYLYLVGRARTVRTDLKPLVRAATNPGGTGHVWVKRRFVDIAPPNTTYLDPESQTTRAFIPAKLQDNQALMQADPGYLRRLGQLPEAERRALRDGDWDVFAGQGFPEWRRELHVCEPFVVPPEWPRWLSVDGGYEHPFVCLWWTRSREDGRIYVYRELVASHLLDSEQAAKILDLSKGERLQVARADPSLWAKRSDTGVSTAQRYAQAGVPLTPASNERVAGKRRIHDLLASREEDGLPGVQVFSNCTKLIACLPTMVIDEHDPEDVAKVDGDDCYDAFRYGAPESMRGNKVRSVRITRG